MKILVTGGGGVLGLYLKNILPDAQYPSRKKLDVSNPNSVRIQLEYEQPDVIIHCAAETSLEVCEKNPEKAVMQNALPLVYLSQYAKETATIIYISSASVFGSLGGQMPTEKFNFFKPTNEYAFSKYIGELFLRRTRKKKQNIVIIRCGWIFGGGKFLSYVLNDLRNNNNINAVDDIRGQPTFAKDLAGFIKQIVDKKDDLFEENIFHFSNIGSASRYDIAVETKNIIGSNSEINRVEDSFFKPTVVRPQREYISMDSTGKFFKEMIFRNWEEALRDYLENYETDDKQENV